MSTPNTLGGTLTADDTLREIDSWLSDPRFIELATKEPRFWTLVVPYALHQYGDSGRARLQRFGAKLGKSGADIDTAWNADHAKVCALTDPVDFLLKAVRARCKSQAPVTAPAPGPGKLVTTTPTQQKKSRTEVAKREPPEGELLPAVDDTIQTLNGRTLSTVSNGVVALTHCPEIQFAYDGFTYKAMIQLPADTALRIFDEDKGDLTAVQIYLQQRAGLTQIGKEATRDAIYFRAHKNHIDSVADWLNSLRWDGTRRLSILMPRGFGTEADRYYIRAGRNLLLSMVARALRPGCQVDEAIVLEGPQGALKSSALRIIGGGNYDELIANPNSKDFEQQLLGVWLGEFAELSTLRRAEDIERVKQFVTNRVDHFRAPYAKDFADHPRRTVLCGSTNSECWIHDTTGGRRFIPVKIGKIDLQWLQDNREQLFAEAVALFKAKAGRQWWAYPKERAREEQAARTSEDPWTAKIRQYLCGRSEIIDLPDLLGHLGVSTERQTVSQLTRVGTILTKLGCTKGRRHVNGAREYYRIVPPELANLPMHGVTLEDRVGMTGVRTVDAEHSAESLI